MRARSALIALALVLGGCTLRPLYGGGADGPVVQALHGIQVAPIPGQGGWLVRTALQDRLGAGEGDPVRYRLEVELDEDITGFGIRSDDAVTRERRTLRALPAGRDRTRPGRARRNGGVRRRHRRGFLRICDGCRRADRARAPRRGIADQIVSRVALYACAAAGGRPPRRRPRRRNEGQQGPDRQGPQGARGNAPLPLPRPDDLAAARSPGRSARRWAPMPSGSTCRRRFEGRSRPAG